MCLQHLPGEENDQEIVIASADEPVEINGEMANRKDKHESEDKISDDDQMANGNSDEHESEDTICDAVMGVRRDDRRCNLGENSHNIGPESNVQMQFVSDEQLEFHSDITAMSDICYFDNIPNEILQQILSFPTRARKDCIRSACNLYRCVLAVNSRFRQITEQKCQIFLPRVKHLQKHSGLLYCYLNDFLSA